MSARTIKARIQKGKDLENYVAEQLVVKGIDPRAKRSFGSGNGISEKSDIYTSAMILGQNIGFECKHADTIHFLEWWKQTKLLEKLSREPVLVIKQTGDKYGDTKAVVYLDTLLELIKNQK